MLTVPVEIQLLFASLLFLIGLTGVCVRRNIIFMLMSIRDIVKSGGTVFIISGLS